MRQSKLVPALRQGVLRKSCESQRQSVSQTWKSRYVCVCVSLYVYVFVCVCVFVCLCVVDKMKRNAGGIKNEQHSALPERNQ